MAKTKASAKTGPKAIAGYVRVSTEAQGNQGFSLDSQAEAIRNYAEKSGLPLVDIFLDVATGAGSESIIDRRGLRNALQACRDFDAVLVVWDWSRLSRHAASTSELRDLLPASDRIVSLKEGEKFRADTEAARIAKAEHERDEISRRTKAGMKRKKDQGAVFGNPDINAVQPKGAAAFKAKADAMVREIVELLRAHPEHSALTRAEVADQLNAKGSRTLHGQLWTAGRVTVQLRKARQLLDEDTVETLPTFGIF
ncbi:recombinase family protein [Paragemmobacter aquarius]|nr:recombinase family protein [Gemmobacter aquarius]